jgi:hypothetical protein
MENTAKPPKNDIKTIVEAQPSSKCPFKRLMIWDTPMIIETKITAHPM